MDHHAQDVPDWACVKHIILVIGIATVVANDPRSLLTDRAMTNNN